MGSDARQTPGDDAPEHQVDGLAGGRCDLCVDGGVGDLLGQIGHRFHRPDEVTRRQLADVAGGHAQGGRERGAPGPRGH